MRTAGASPPLRILRWPLRSYVRPGNRISRRRSDQFAKQVLVADRQRRWRMQPKPQPIQAMDRSGCWAVRPHSPAGRRSEREENLPSAAPRIVPPPGDAKTELLRHSPSWRSLSRLGICDSIPVSAFDPLRSLPACEIADCDKGEMVPFRTATVMMNLALSL